MPRRIERARRGGKGGGEKKLADVGRWLSGADRQDCGDCRRAFAPTAWDTAADRERKKNGPPCATCRPGVLEANVTAYHVYLRCSGQVIVGPMGDRIDINILAVKCLMDLEGVTDQAETLEKVQALAGAVFREQKREAGRQRQASLERDR